MSQQDPFNLVREEVSKAIDETLNQLSAVKSIRASSEAGASGKSSIYVAAKRELRSMVESAVWQVEELSRAVDVSERDPSRFRLDMNEVKKRRDWVENAKLKLVKVKREIDNDYPGKHTSGINNNGNNSSYNNNSLTDTSVNNNDNDFEMEHSNQRLLMKEQDDDLEDISTSLQKLGQYGLQIGEELKNQEYLLSELDEDVITTQARLDAVRKKMAQVFKKARSNYQLCLILFLTILLMVLIGMVFS